MNPLSTAIMSGPRLICSLFMIVKILLQTNYEAANKKHELKLTFVNECLLSHDPLGQRVPVRPMRYIVPELADAICISSL